MMKKVLVLGICAIMSVSSGYVNVNEMESDKINILSDEKAIMYVLEKEDGILTDRIEIYETENDDSCVEDDYVNFKAYDENDNLVTLGGIDVSYARNMLRHE